MFMQTQASFSLNISTFCLQMLMQFVMTDDWICDVSPREKINVPKKKALLANIYNLKNKVWLRN